MKKSIKKSLMLFGLVSAISLVQAQESAVQLTGWEAAVGVGTQSNKVNYQGFLAGHDSSAHDTASFLAVRYGWAIEAPWVVTVGARYDLQKADYGSTTYTNGGTQTVSAKYRTGLSVSVEPGYIIRPDWMVYGKLSLNRANGEFADTGAPSGTTRHSGYGLGLGVATQFSDRWVGRFEVSQVNYSREPGNLSTGKPTSTATSISVGYRF